MKIAVLGLGIMGRAIATKLLEAGHEIVVWNRTIQATEELVRRGARLGDSPAEAASRTEFTITMLTNPEAVDDVTLGKLGIIEGIQENSVHLEMSTVSPESAKKLATIYQQRARKFVQAPVMGSKVQIEQKQLLVVAGGNHDDIARGLDVWNVFAKNVWTVDSPEQASALKLSVNMLLAQMILALGQSFAIAKSYGIEPSLFLEIISQSSLSSGQYQSNGAAILKNDFTPNFTVANLLKDVMLTKTSLADKGGEFPLNDTAVEIFQQAVADGYANDDYSAVVKSIATLGGVALS